MIDEEFGVTSVLEELAGDEETQEVLDKEIDAEDDAEESITADPPGISDSDAIDLIAGLNDPYSPDYIEVYSI